MSVSNFLKVGIVADDKTKKGITSAEKNIQGLNNTVKSLGKAFATVFAAQKIMAFGKASVKAFIEDEKSVTKLNTAVKNLGLELSAPSINKYIENLSKISGVTDEQLRPAFQALITTTGSVTASQKALTQAIDVSAGSGIALETVAQDLANAYVGNTRGLKKYNLGLTQAQLKTASFADISDKLNKQFSGANAAYLETYAGKMQLISTAAGEAQEKIGQGLIDLALAVSGATDVQDLIGKIATATDFAVARLDNFIEGWKILKTIINSSLGDFNKNIQAVQVEEFNRRLKRDYLKAWAGTNIPKSAQQTAAEKAAEAAAKKRAADLLKATAKNTAELKKQAALKKAGTVFDLEQIQLIAALKNNLSAEERTRVQAQLALLNENDVLAQQLTKQILMAQDATGGLYKYFLTIGDTKIKNPFAFLDQWILDFQKKLEDLTKLKPVTNPFVVPTGFDPELAKLGVVPGYGDFAGSTTNPYSNEVLNGLYGMQSTAGFVSTTSVTGSNVNVYVSGSVVTEQELVDAITTGLRSNSLSGSPSQIGRIAGMFG